MKIAVIGAGNMGGAIALGAIKNGIINPADMVIADPRAPLSEIFGNTGVKVVADNNDAVREADFVIVAVKPWLMEQVVTGIAPILDRSRQALVSIAAGVSFAQLNEYLDSDKLGATALFRVIPNTAISLGKSATFISAHGATTEQESDLHTFFKAMGEVYPVSEELMPAVTSLSSSGIAYALKYIDSAVRGGEELGVERSEALPIVIQTIKGALALLEANNSQPQEEIDKVTTPNGITIKGLTIMEQNGFSNAVIKGIKGE